MAIPEYLLIHTVVIVEPRYEQDAYGNDVPVYDLLSPRTAVTGRMQQDSRQLVAIDGGAPLQANWLLLTNYTSASRRARVEWGGMVFELDGQPDPAFDLVDVHHAELALRIVDG